MTFLRLLANLCEFCTISATTYESTSIDYDITISIRLLKHLGAAYPVLWRKIDKMTPYDVIENNGVLAPSRREAIIDPTVGANHNDKPAHGKTFLTRTRQAQIRHAG